jgi:sulfatase modifying factor 1
LRSVKEELAPCYRIGGSTNPNDWGSIPTFKDSIWDAVICDWNANGYRLPTEAEWEYAARGATNEPDYLYSGSDKIEYVAWYLDNSEDTSHPVGEKKDNSIGIYDMSGNIWEWCWDRYSDSYYRSSPRNNPVGPSSGLSRVFRGGGWNYNASLCRVANRADGAPYESYIFVGFRVCRSAP